eukprot:364409-Chlamydomonas_euryale.AAC.19
MSCTLYPLYALQQLQIFTEDGPGRPPQEAELVSSLTAVASRCAASQRHHQQRRQRRGSGKAAHVTAGRHPVHRSRAQREASAGKSGRPPANVCAVQLSQQQPCNRGCAETTVRVRAAPRAQRFACDTAGTKRARRQQACRRTRQRQPRGWRQRCGRERNAHIRVTAKRARHGTVRRSRRSAAAIALASAPRTATRSLLLCLSFSLSRSRVACPTLSPCCVLLAVARNAVTGGAVGAARPVVNPSIGSIGSQAAAAAVKKPPEAAYPLALWRARLDARQPLARAPRGHRLGAAATPARPRPARDHKLLFETRRAWLSR